MSGPRVALVHDWLTGMRGGEKVLESLCGMFPDADVFTLFYRPDRISEKIRAHRIVASWLNRLPGATRYYRYLLPLMPRAIESFDLTGYDLVISSSHAVAKGVRVPEGVRHICYCHTPMRYIWSQARDYFQVGLAGRIKRPLLVPFSGWLREWDVRSNRGVTEFIANSENVRARIRESYDRDARVVYPPVDTQFFTPHPNAESDYYLVVSALEPYKRVDLAIQAAARLGRRLVITGRGTQMGMLKRLAAAVSAGAVSAGAAAGSAAAGRVEFTGWVSDDRLRDLYRGCRALLFPGLEDFGMCPVEAQACGRPVIAYGAGGALESVVPGTTGLFFPEQCVDSLTNAIEDFESRSFDPTAARSNSLRFSRQRFLDGISAAMSAAVSAGTPGRASNAVPDGVSGGPAL
jgi:glycosyltransferase involved in cell wall biosynthesis